MQLSVVIPARDEGGCIQETLSSLMARLGSERIDYEIIVVDDGSSDDTPQQVCQAMAGCTRIRFVQNSGRRGYGFAVRAGLAACRGDAVAIMMADGSDSPEDLARYYRVLLQGYDCAFGSRFIRGSLVVGYPAHKLVINRVANTFVRLLFGLRYNDVTNAFKCYRRHVIDAMQPLISPHFNLTVEMPLKAIVRGYSYAVVPITWTNRKSGISKLKLKEMGSRYLFIVLYLWLEKYLSRGDYHRSSMEAETSNRTAVTPSV